MTQFRTVVQLRDQGVWNDLVAVLQGFRDQQVEDLTVTDPGDSIAIARLQGAIVAFDTIIKLPETLAEDGYG
jgi:hypothetical protein